MKKVLKLHNNILIIALPLLIICTMVMLAKSSAFDTNSSQLSLAITVDLLLITPFIYFLLIRKTKIPKTTVVAFVILGIVVGSFIIPTENQYHLNLFKIWILPLLELAVLSFVVYKIIKARQLYKLNAQNTGADFYSILKTTCENILPKKIVILVVTEIAVFYYGFINWKKPILKPNEFTYHKNSGTIGLLIAMLFLIAIETVAIHLLLSKWSTTAAWILTGLSMYSAIQILGFLKSITKRPICIDGNLLYFKYGIMKETTIDTKHIKSVELSTKDIELSDNVSKLSFLGDLEGHNCVITLKEPNTLTGLYGTKKSYTTLALFVDNKLEFKKQLDVLLDKNQLVFQ